MKILETKLKESEDGRKKAIYDQHEAEYEVKNLKVKLKQRKLKLNV